MIKTRTNLFIFLHRLSRNHFLETVAQRWSEWQFWFRAKVHLAQKFLFCRGCSRHEGEMQTEQVCVILFQVLKYSPNLRLF